MKQQTMSPSWCTPALADAATVRGPSRRTPAEAPSPPTADASRSGDASPRASSTPAMAAPVAVASDLKKAPVDVIRRRQEGLALLLAPRMSVDPAVGLDADHHPPRKAPPRQHGRQDERAHEAARIRGKERQRAGDGPSE